MGSAMVLGILKSGIVCKRKYYCIMFKRIKCRKNKNELGINTTLDNKEVCNNSDIIFLAVKPYMYEKKL